mmetsp:Transcript_35573/g.77673  ORF Transcript_35573/g.77673 Transcript_35573/m.77673 type:complete len:164 (-) Transcript_35573:128-619(-)|eukprot:CAMPEP_0118926166 /NCGR_PEP_ID=MMETSP1169-20130426/3928_1 /TAXON_ID=36882 /ORGANISM="Pyramimonas obovata, Strain CCMP722" /LENGTH=163 /DNA_ID=CAMNT_0006867665 /DNA_START=235 /DNA_END=726 /DNA_ORIENTATION=-
MADERNLSALHAACDDGDLEQVMKLHASSRAEFNVCDDDKQFALHHACQGGNLNLVKYVAENSWPNVVNIKDVYGMTPFHLACEGGDKAIVQYLLKLDGFDPRLRRSSACFIAARHQHTQLVEFLMEGDPKGFAEMAKANSTMGCRSPKRQSGASEAKSCVMS